MASPAPPSLPGSPLGELGGMPSIGSGLSGFGQQLADLIGGLAGSSDGASPNLDAPDLTDDDEPFGERDSDQPEADADEEDEPDAEGEPTDPADAAPVEPEVPEDSAAAEPEAPSEPPDPTPTPVPPPIPEPPPAQDVAAEQAERTPCEIAADELPQVGE